jgi:hypothetical protein
LIGRPRVSTLEVVAVAAEETEEFAVSTQKARITPDRVGRLALKYATEAGYVLAGLADVVAGTVQDVVNARRETAAQRRTDASSPMRDYAKAVPGQVKGLVGEATEAYRDLAARGRVVLAEGFASTAHRDVAPAQPSWPRRADDERPADADFEQPPTS